MYDEQRWGEVNDDVELFHSYQQVDNSAAAETNQLRHHVNV